VENHIKLVSFLKKKNIDFQLSKRSLHSEQHLYVHASL